MRLKVLQAIHLSLIAMPAVFAAVVYYLISQEQTQRADMVYWYILVGFTAAAGIISQVLYRSALGKIQSASGLDEKIGSYTPAVLMRNAPWEAAALLCGALALINKDPLLLLPCPAIAVVMFVIRPGTDSARIDLHLTQEEVRQLEESN